MSKALIIVSIIFITTSSACGSAAPSPPEMQLSTPQSVTSTQEIAVPEPVPPVIDSTLADATDVVAQMVSAPPGLQVVYLHEGNLWIWTEANDNVMLTGSGDISTAGLSNDGQLLAFMRAREVWTIRMDCTDARLHVTQGKDGGALRFAPNGSLLAVSTIDHMDVVDLTNANTRSVVTYRALPDGYYPEVVWSSDSVGFKTIIPPGIETDQAEFLFVLANGTIASLAKFSMGPLSESRPFIAPDGGYVMYVTKVAGEQESLHLMDSSGATRPYGQSAVRIHPSGWLPDSIRFIYMLENPERTFLGDVAGNAPMEIVGMDYDYIRWLDADRFLATQEGNLYLGRVSVEKSLIAESVSDFDFSK